MAHESMPPSLHDAVASGDVALATKLIDASLTSNGGGYASRNTAVMDRAGDIMGRTALHVAAEKGHVGMVEFLVGECQAEVNARDSQGARPMHYAAEGNKLEALDALLRNGAKVTMAVSVAPRHGLPPPPPANFTHQWAPSFVASKGLTDPRRTRPQDDQGELPMHWACARGSRDACESLLRAGVSPTVPTKSGWTPMHVAALNGRAELLDALIRRIRKTRGDTELIAALNAQLPTNGRTALHLAATNAKLGAIETLANNGADPEARDSNGLRPADMTLNAGVRSLLGARTVGGGCGVGGAKVAATVTTAVAAARFKKGGGGGLGGGLGGGGGVGGVGGSGGGGDRTRGDRAERGTPAGPSGPTPTPPGAPRSSRSPRLPTERVVRAGIEVTSVADGIGALKVEEDVDFQERVRDELRRNRERLKGPLGGPSAGGARRVHPAGANKEFLGKYGLENKRDLFAP